MNNEIKFIERGWECPKCGAIMAPHMDVCVNCRGNNGDSLATTQPSLDKFLHPNFAPSDTTKPYPYDFDSNTLSDLANVAPYNTKEEDTK